MMVVDQTPRLTEHARERCAEMGLTTKRAKRVVQNPDVVYPGRRGEGADPDAYIALSDEDTEIAVVFVPEEPPRIITVLWNGDFSREVSP